MPFHTKEYEEIQRACGQRRRSNRPGNSQAKGPIICIFSEELLACFVCQRTEGANGALLSAP